MTTFTRVTDDVDDVLAAHINQLIDGLQQLPGPDGWMINGKLSVTVASNNITVAVKTLAGNDPSSTDPVAVRIGDTVRVITSALSITVNAGTNWFNSGATGLATKEADYFVYLGYNATDGVVIGFARIPWSSMYSEFSTNSVNESYCAISNIAHAAAGDAYVNVGRFAATLSAAASYNWSVPAFTARNLIQRPSFETRWLDWVPQQSGEGSLTWTSPTVNMARYMLRGHTLYWQASVAATLGGSAANSLYLTAPFQAAQRAYFIACGAGFAGALTGTVWITPAVPDKITVDRYDSSNYPTSGALTLDVAGCYEI